jgi:hypothetical protein
MENVDQDMKDVVIKAFPQPCPEIGKCSFTRDLFLGESGVLAISPSPVFISKEFKELAHILIPINIAEQIDEKQTRWIVAWRSLN